LFVCFCPQLSGSSTIRDLKKQVHSKKQSLYPDRQSFRLEVKGKSLSDNDTLSSLGLKSGSLKIYVKDLGPQIGWKTVFIVEYAGPLFVYLWIYTRPWLFYGIVPSNVPISKCAQ
jgi:very-long-chain enoyl-CoA reductase